MSAKAKSLEKTEEKNELSVVSVDTAIAQFNQFEKEIAELEKQFKDRVYDMDDKKENDQARSDRVALSKVATKVDNLRKELKKEAEKTATEIHKYGQGIHVRVTALRDPIKAQVDKWEAKQKRIEEEKAKVAAELEEKIETLRNIPLVTGNETVDDLTILISDAQLIKIDDTYGKRTGEAKKLLDDGVASLQMFHENTVEAEKQKAELAQLLKEKEEREAQEIADEEARLQREREEEIAETARQEEREKINNEPEISTDENQPVLKGAVAEPEVQEKLNEIKSENPAPEDQIPEAGFDHSLDVENKKTKNNEALRDLTTYTFVSEETARLIVKAIVSDKIRNVTINY